MLVLVSEGRVSGVADGPRPEAGVSIDVPDAAREGSVLVVRVHLPEAVLPSSADGEVTLTRTIAYRYREGGRDGGTHLATARRSEVVARQGLPGPEPGGPYDVEVLLPVPAEGPASADTQLVTVDWAVRARLDLGAAGAAQAVRKITVLTDAAAFEAAVTQPPHADTRGHSVVTIEGLSARRIVPGARLTGQVVVVPLHPGPIRTVRLELVLHEHVPHGPESAGWAMGGKSCSTVVAAADLASGIEAGEAWRALRVPFVLEVPESLRAPSMATAEFELAWTLRAVVSRPLHRDAYAELALRAATAVPPVASPG